MTPEPPAPNPPVAAHSSTLATTTTALGVILMALVGALVVPVGRILLGALYGIVEAAVLHPFGLALPAIVTFLLINLCFLATALAAGRRVGAILAHRLIDKQLGSHRVVAALPWIAGAAGAAAFTASVPFSVGESVSLPLQVAYVTAGYLLYLPILLIGPPRGARRFLDTHPYCHRCWLWMQAETGGGSYRPADIPTVTTALAAADLPRLRDLPLAGPSLSGSTCSLHWWRCATCDAEAVVTAALDDPTGTSRAVSTHRLAGQSVARLRALITHRRTLAHPPTPTPPPSAAHRA